MKIEQILIQPIGQRFNAGTLTIKTCKKTWRTKGYNLASADIWWHQVIFMDNTGEIPADVKIGKYLPLKRGQDVNLIICEVRDAEYLGKPRKILFVEQYSLPTTTVDDYNTQEDEWFTAQQDQIKGKIRHGEVCAYIEGYTKKTGAMPTITATIKKSILEWQEFVLTGE